MPNKIDPEKVKQGIKIYAGKKNMKEIALVLGVSHSTVFKYANELGLDMGTPQTRNKILLDRSANRSGNIFKVEKKQNWLV